MILCSYKHTRWKNPHKWKISSPSMYPALTNAQSCTLENPHKWKISTPSRILCIQLLQTHMLEKSSQMENFLTQYKESMHPALTSAHTEKSSQMENFLTQYDDFMHPALTNTHTHTRWKNLRCLKSSMIGLFNCLTDIDCGDTQGRCS